MAVTFIAYQPVWHAGFIWDDNEHILQHFGVTAPDGLRAIWSSCIMAVYYPLTFTVFRLIYQTWGANPLPYHAITLALHAVNAALLLRVLHRLDVRGAWVVATVWAVHPVNVESVAWATELKNTLSGAWFFGSILCFLRHEREPSLKWYGCALVSSAAALLSKSSTVVLPMVLLLCAWWQRHRIARTDVVRTLPFFALSLAASVVAVWAAVREKIGEGPARDWSLQPLERLIVAGKDIWFYVSKIAWPFDLMFIYPRWSHDVRVLTEWLPLAGALIAGIVLWRFRRGAWGRASAFALGYFVVALLPILGFFDLYFYRYSFVADHFQYLASAGLIALAVSASGTVSQLIGQRGRSLGMFAAEVVVLILAVSTWKQARLYQDVESIYRVTIARNPSCWMAYNNLGGLLLEQGRLAEAVETLQQALRFKADDGGVHNNLGTAMFRQGRFVEAATQYREAVRLKPYYAEAHYNLGNAASELGLLDEAVTQYRRAIELDGDYAEAQYNLANTLLRQNMPAQAIEHYRAAARLRPGDADAQYSLANVLAQQGDLVEAVARYQLALQIKPDHIAAHYDLANTLIRLDQPHEAVAHYREALRLQPDLLAAEFNLATALFSLGNTREAIEHFQRAVALKPDLAEAHSKLGAAFAKLTEFDNATNSFGRALQLKADLTDAQADLAWLLGTHAGATVIDVQRAAVLATRACQLTANQNPAFLDALAAAYAAAGQFPQAVETAGQAEALAAKSAAVELTRQIQLRLDLYRNGRAYQAAVMTPLPSDW